MTIRPCLALQKPLCWWCRDPKPSLWLSPAHGTLLTHVPNARIEVIPGAEHAVPLTHPEALAEALAEFFAVTRQPA